MRSTRQSNTFAVAGGDRRRLRFPKGCGVRHYESSRYGGRGAIRRLVAALRTGKITHLFLLVRWLGHSDCDAIRIAADAAGVPVHIVPGGSSQLSEMLDIAGRESRRVH